MQDEKESFLQLIFPESRVMMTDIVSGWLPKPAKKATTKKAKVAA
jgi:hypothetical protein